MAQHRDIGSRETGSRRLGRPSVVAERRRQILDAVEECIIEYGLASTTLECIAAQAGLTRSNLAYFVGNRDEIIEAALERSVSRFVDEMKGGVAGLPPEDRLPEFLRLTFVSSDAIRRSTKLMNELSTAAAHHRHARDVLLASLELADDWIGDMIHARYPHADVDMRAQVAALLPLALRELDRDRQLNGSHRSQEYVSLVKAAVDALLGLLGPPATGNA